MRPKAEWTDNGKAVSISHDGNTVTIPIDQIDDLAEILYRMAYHGYVKHHKAPQGSDYGRRELPVDPEE